MTEVTVYTKYLELRSIEDFKPAYIDDDAVLVMEASQPFPEFYRFLFDVVGRRYCWDDRLGWSDDQIRKHFTRPDVSLLVAYVNGVPAGYLELNAQSSETGTEITHFGIVAEFQGRGLGKHLLSVGVQKAFSDGAKRVWLHTDNFDSPHALPNYTARGFSVVRETTHQDTILER